MARINIKNTIKEIFNKNPKKEFTVNETLAILDERYALVPKSPTKSVPHYLMALTRDGFLIRRKNDRGKYTYRRRSGS